MINGTEVICLCGSTRFTKKMLDLAWDFNKQGIITLGWDYHPDGFDKDWSELNHGEADDLGIREMLDKNHLLKIDLADEVFVVNVGGYIGDGTRREIKYATKQGKPIHYLETSIGAH